MDELQKLTPTAWVLIAAAAALGFGVALGWRWYRHYRARKALRAPELSRVALLWDAGTGPVQVDALNKTAKALDIQTDLLEVKARDDYTGAFAIAKDRGVGAAIMLSTPLVPASAKLLAEHLSLLSNGLKHRGSSRAEYLERMRTAVRIVCRGAAR